MQIHMHIPTRLGVQDQELTAVVQQASQMQAAHSRICSALTQLTSLNDNPEVLVKKSVSDMDIAQAIQQLKAQKRDVWNEIQHLRKVCFTVCFSITGFVNMAATHT
jgi:uncharacterized protein involved in exopolysaccharide biosynthesis